ncbi:EscU/YscU/HrcU family type III secretion system export apparatus switch protein [Paludibacterium yongneupense]|uniref:EscU/YscU/HrcU family type III secretion system export apparatus switch protein n=1 Tax=Paludibacterium yongneupense TaxID=400061 RepID=UPI000429B5DD|nr:EscU/YscU/HrcU family type III secretion system export apparatus switch protein [Paludibacterium yongneupense]
MSEKTEKPSAKRLRESRAKGQVVRSAEIVTGVQVALALGFFMFKGGALFDALRGLIVLTIDVVAEPVEVAAARILDAVIALCMDFLGTLALLIIAGSIVAGAAQVGPLLAGEALKPQLSRISPLSHAKQLFSLKSVFEFGKSLAKVVLLGVIFSYLLKRYAASFRYLPACTLSCGLEVTVRLVFWMWAVLVAFYVLFGIGDYAFQRFSVMKQLRMSKQELKQEYKDAEGSPDIRHKRRELHREVQSGSLAANVARSTVLVKNPTRIAVCLYYRIGETPLPQVVETGRDAMARHMVRLAERAGIPVVEDIALARRLISGVAPGDFISPELFDPVARLLRAVMDLPYDHDPDGTDEHDEE